MPKPPAQLPPAAGKPAARERLLLFCVASGTDWQWADSETARSLAMDDREIGPAHDWA
jgi:hypothetical protein